MRDELSDIFGTSVPEPSHEDPVRRAQIQMKRPQAKRFYTTVTVEPEGEGFSVKLDGKGVKTPGKRPLTLPTHAAAELVAAEWRAQVAAEQAAAGSAQADAGSLTTGDGVPTERKEP